MRSDFQYFQQLYEIASSLNREFSLHAALKTALEKTVQFLELETGWIWLMQGEHAVNLAATFNLPPALKEHPEKLSGPCYCIERYLSGKMDSAENISEITCSRLKNMRSGTRDLKFHASVPIRIAGRKVGLINLVSKKSQQLTDTQLFVLNTVGELIGIAIQRTQSQDAGQAEAAGRLPETLKRVFSPRIEAIAANLERASTFARSQDIPWTLKTIDRALDETRQLGRQLSLVLEETKAQDAKNGARGKLQYPVIPLTERETELLALVRKGLTNKQIGEHLFITERTVKFHLSSILSKLSARTRTEAVDIALKRGVLGL